MTLNDIRKPFKKYLPYLLQAHEQKLNEADTVQRIIEVFKEVLGYNGMTEITRECAINEKYVDIAIKLEGTIRLLIEVKAGGIELRDRHIEQAKHYASEANIQWVVLTNGVEWILYHLTFEEGVNYDKAFALDFTKSVTDRDIQMLAILHKKSLASEQLEEFWDHKVALSPSSIAKALFHEDILTLIRRELKRVIDVRVEEEALAHALHDMLSTEAREYIGPMKIIRKRKPRAKVTKSNTAAGGPLPEIAVPLSTEVETTTLKE